MPQMETEQLNQIVVGAALSRAVCTVANLGVADHINSGTPRSARDLAKATGTHERSRAGFARTSLTPTSTMVSVIEGKPIPVE
jgi:hypothetical protein